MPDAGGGALVVAAAKEAREQAMATGLAPVKVLIAVSATAVEVSQLVRAVDAAAAEPRWQVIDQETNARIQSCSVASVAYTGINPVDKKCFVFTTKNEARLPRPRLKLGGLTRCWP